MFYPNCSTEGLACEGPGPQSKSVPTGSQSSSTDQWSCNPRLHPPGTKLIPTHSSLIHHKLELSPACICDMGLAKLRSGFLDPARIFSRSSPRRQNTRGRGEPSPIFIFMEILTNSTSPCQPVSKGIECDSGRGGRGGCTRVPQQNRT